MRSNSRMSDWVLAAVQLGLLGAQLGDPLGHVVPQGDTAGVTIAGRIAGGLIGVFQPNALGARLGESLLA